MYIFTEEISDLTPKFKLLYGIINKALEDLVRVNFGEAKWKVVLEKSGIELDYFISNEPYDDEITYKIAIAVSEVTNITLDQVMFSFGEWWILKTTKEKYGGLLEAGGNNLMEFLTNLPKFHNHIMLMYPKLTPPEFKTSNIKENSIQIHYYSKREGLKEFVRGLLSGVSKMYQCETIIELISSRNNGDDHETYKVSW